MREATKTEGAATLEDIEEFSDGLICLTGGDEGPIAPALVDGLHEDASKLIDRLSNIFGHGNLYLELQRHQQRDEECRNQLLLRFAAAHCLPVIATNGVRYATEKDSELLDVFTTIRHHTSLDQAGRLLTANDSRSLRSPREMAALFRDIPEAVANTHIVSERLGFALNNLGYEFPQYPVPNGETMDSFLDKARRGRRSQTLRRRSQAIFARQGPHFRCNTNSS